MLPRDHQRDTLADIQPPTLHAYLEYEGWSPIDELPPAGIIFGKPGVSAQILFSAQQLADYRARVEDAIFTLAEAEGRDWRETLRDVTLTDYDLIRIRLLNPPGKIDALPLNYVAQRYQAARHLLQAAACPAVQPRGFHQEPEAVPEAAQYMEQVKTGRPEPGPFVITLLSPAPEPGHQEPHFPRQVSGTLIAGLQGIHEALTDTIEGRKSGRHAFAAQIGQGVSANLCNAVAAMLDDGEINGIEVSVSKTPHSAGQSGRIAAPPIHGESRKTIEAAAKTLRIGQKRPNVNLTAIVQDWNSSGAVTLQAIVEGDLKTVRIQAPEQIMDVAIEAYEQRLAVHAAGDVAWEPRGWTLRNPTRLELK